MRSKKLLVLATSLVLGSSLFAGCGSQNNSSGSSQSPAASTSDSKASAPTPTASSSGKQTAESGLIPDVKGELTVQINPAQLNAADPDLGAVYDYFHKYYPDLKLTQQSRQHEFGAPAELTKAVAAGQAPDVYITTPGDIPSLVRQGYAEPIDDLLKANPQYVDSLTPSALDSNKFNGKTYGVNWLSLPQDWLINVDLFEKMGVPVPTDDWTIDDFIAVNKKLVDKANGITGSNVAVNDIYNIFSFLQAYGVKGFKMVDGKPVANFGEDPNATAAIDKWIEYTTKDNIAFTDDEMKKFGLDKDWQAFWTSGRTGMVPWSLWAQPYDRDKQANRFKWAVLRAPKGPAGRGTLATAITLSIFPGSKNKDLAMKYIQILTSKHFYDNAKIMDPKTKAVAFSINFNPAEKIFPIGMPAIKSDFKTTPENQPALDGFVRSLQDIKPADFGGAGQAVVADLAGRLKDVASGKAQTTDMLKEFDKYVNEKYYSTQK